MAKASDSARLKRMGKPTEKALALALKLGGASAGLGSDALLRARLQEMAFACNQESYREPEDSRRKMLQEVARILGEIADKVSRACTECECESTASCGCCGGECSYAYSTHFEI